ncbi:MAG: ABC transporter permease [Candidatus Hadarchaeota archaeon]
MGVPLIEIGDFSLELPRNPAGEVLNDAINFLVDGLPWLFDGITWVLKSMSSAVYDVLNLVPPEILIAILAIAMWRTVGLKMVPFGTLLLLLIWNMELWEPTIDSLALMITALLITWIIGIPLGIWKAHSKILDNILTPVLDTMQTTPPMTYLIPAILFFGIGEAPSIVAIIIFTVAPPIRTTSLGIEQISQEIIEAGKAFGASSKQIITKIELPMAVPTILVGINQSIMIGFTMVVLAGFIGAGGLGEIIIRAIMQAKIGRGLEAGLAVVFLAIIMDRVLRNIGRGA